MTLEELNKIVDGIGLDNIMYVSRKSNIDPKKSKFSFTLKDNSVKDFDGTKEDFDAVHKIVCEGKQRVKVPVAAPIIPVVVKKEKQKVKPVEETKPVTTDTSSVVEKKDDKVV